MDITLDMRWSISLSLLVIPGVMLSGAILMVQRADRHNNREGRYNSRDVVGDCPLLYRRDSWYLAASIGGNDGWI